MGEADRYIDYKQPRKKFLLGDDNNALVALFTLNVIVFILLRVIHVIYANAQGGAITFETEMLPYFELPASLPQLAVKPWTALTAMFTHFDVMGMIGNMLWLWAFGYIFQDLAGNRKLIPVYLYGGLAGALVFIITANVTARGTVNTYWLSGANASNMALAAAATMLAPDYRFFRNIAGGIPIWVLTLIYIIIDFAGAAANGFKAPYNLSHLAGAGAGFLFVYLVRRGYDGSEWMNRAYRWLMNLFSPAGTKKSNPVKEKVFYNAGERKPFKKTTNVTQQRVDEILDKINQKGYHFLTDEEKNILNRAADEDVN